MVARRLRLSNWWQRLFHSPSTAFPQAEAILKLDTTAASLADLRHEVTLMRRDMEDFEERTAKRLDRYRKWYQGRKGGKFANEGLEDDAQSQNTLPLVPGDTHETIASRARQQGLIS